MLAKKRRILITSALPYANGDLHLGHILGYVQADIWSRYQRMAGHECYYICGDDAHGTPIMLHAKQQNISAEELIAQYYTHHQADFAKFSITFDNYYTTHSTENQQLAYEIYAKIKERGYLITKTIQQAYDETAAMFLPDRFIKGTCPRCKTPDQYGDSCEKCGATYSSTDLIKPYSIITNTTPIYKTSEHIFFDLPQFTDFLQNWFKDSKLQAEIINKLQEWFSVGLTPWDITRDAPYFGFAIPDRKDQFFYVWLDAPIGYMAAWLNYCHNDAIKFAEFWHKDATDTELYHFIGKDITYFHALFWPALLYASDYRLPTNIFVNGFLTVNGEKMSKSRGTFLLAQNYLQQWDSDYLRYYFAAKLSSKIEDIDLNLLDFQQRVNSDLIGKLVNLASRSASFLAKYFDNTLSTTFGTIDTSLWTETLALKTEILTLYEQREYSHLIRRIMAIADKANQYFDHHKPWQLIKDDVNKAQVHCIITMMLNIFKNLIIYLKPVLPNLAIKTEALFQVAPWQWSDIEEPLLNRHINHFTALLTRITPEQIAAFDNIKL